ncbi:MAG: type III-A CRISPR-associated protein Cas10/Csm1, partial [Planctomycetota bacterium]|nr:type III-A CRISPR-associated protein Cas10/Csm1 [Planctomycetota bacterium]
DEGGSLWNGYSRRFINGYVPRFGSTDAATQDRYEEIAGEEEEHHEGDLKTFSHLACEDRYLREDGKWCGISALSVVKGDVDDLGEIFRKGLESPTFAKMAALSRQMNAFFSIYLPNLCATKFENCYTVFAGGDDFFVVGPWKSQMRLLKNMREDFARYVVNDSIHFSAGISTVKPGIPIRTMAENAEEALGSAKTRLVGKNSVNCYGNTVHWDRWSELLEIEERMARLQSTYGLSTGYLYGLVELSEMAGRVNENPENAIWLSRFVYRSKRFVGDKMKRESNSRKEQAFSDLLLLAEDIRKYGTAFKIPLFNHLYTYR